MNFPFVELGQKIGCTAKWGCNVVYKEMKDKATRIWFKGRDDCGVIFNPK